MIIIIVFLLLVLIQASRAVLVQIMQTVYEPAMLYRNFTLVLIGIILLIIFRQSRNSLGLDLNSLSRGKKKLYILITTVIFILIFMSLMLFSVNYEDIILTLESAFIFPVFEELLFRGYLWNRLEDNKIAGWKVYILTTVLFGLWHLGYWDVIYYNAHQHFDSVNMPEIMFYKVLVGMVFGMITGFVRLKTKNSYSSILVHSFLNIFGR